MHSSATEVDFSPSELVVLHPARFAAKDTVLSAGFAPLTGGDKVKAGEVADALLSVALLANQRAGVLRLEFQKKKTFFGLFTRTAFVAVPTGTRHSWPQGSLEDAVQRSLAGSGPAEASWLLHGVLEEDVPDPVTHAIGLVIRGLHQRGLLATHETKRLRVFTSTSHAPTPEGAEAIAASDPAATEALLGEARANPEFWKAVHKAVGAGLGLRKEHDSNSDYAD